MSILNLISGADDPKYVHEAPTRKSLDEGGGHGTAELTPKGPAAHKQDLHDTEDAQPLAGNFNDDDGEYIDAILVPNTDPGRDLTAGAPVSVPFSVPARDTSTSVGNVRVESDHASEAHVRNVNRMLAFQVTVGGGAGVSQRTLLFPADPNREEFTIIGAIPFLLAGDQGELPMGIPIPAGLPGVRMMNYTGPIYVDSLNGTAGAVGGWVITDVKKKGAAL